MPRLEDGAVIIHQHWRNSRSSFLKPGSKYKKKAINVAIIDETVEVFVESNGRTVRRRYSDLVSCYSCKVRSFLDDSELSSDSNASPDSDPGSISGGLPILRRVCFFCNDRQRKLTLKIARAVRSALRSGHSYVHSVFTVDSSVPRSVVHAISTRRSNETEPCDHRLEVRHALLKQGYLCEAEGVGDVLRDLQADLDLGHARLNECRRLAKMAYESLGLVNKDAAKRKYGSRTFSGSEAVGHDVFLQIGKVVPVLDLRLGGLPLTSEKESESERERGGQALRDIWMSDEIKDMSDVSLHVDDWTSLRRVLREGQEVLSGWKHDIRWHERAVRRLAGPGYHDKKRTIDRRLEAGSGRGRVGNGNGNGNGKGSSNGNVNGHGNDNGNGNGEEAKGQQVGGMKLRLDRQGRHRPPPRQGRRKDLHGAQPDSSCISAPSSSAAHPSRARNRSLLALGPDSVSIGPELNGAVVPHKRVLEVRSAR